MDLNDNICFSGGARGADHAWGLMAEDQGHRVIHFSFKGHKTSISRHSTKCLGRREYHAYVVVSPPFGPPVYVPL